MNLETIQIHLEIQSEFHCISNWNSNNPSPASCTGTIYMCIMTYLPRLCSTGQGDGGESDQQRTRTWHLKDKNQNEKNIQIQTQTTDIDTV